MNAKTGKRAAHDALYVDNEFRRMLFKFIILKKTGEKDIYAYKMLKEVEKLPQMEFFCKDKNKLKNDIYNAISALSKDGYIKVKSKKVSNHIRNYYTLTKEGRESIMEIRENFIGAVARIKKILKV
ncbi:MAG: PadR family transcriptional regulator [Candidatus Micrarchaeaceae archaeon]